MDKGKAASGKGVSKKITPKPYQRPRGGEARAVSDLMPEIGRAAFRRFGFVQSSVVSRWDEIVGARYAAVSAPEAIRSEEHTSELQSLMRTSYAVFCLQK